MSEGNSSSIGWDTSLAGQSWSAPLNESDSLNTPQTSTTTDNSDPSYLLDRMKAVTTDSKPKDANDYSRFKNIGASDSDDEQAKSKENAAPIAPAPSNDTCRNCSKPGAKLKCSVCKKAVYCARACQAGDWTFHKRICKKPEEKKAASPPKRPASSKPSSSSSNSASSSAQKKTKPKSTEVVVDDPDLPRDDLRGYKNGLPYFHRELSEHEQNLIGDIAPQKIEVAPEVAQPVAHSGSAWNHAGTFEERNFTKWCEQKWSELFSNAEYTDGPYAVTFKDPEKITGDASICVVRGKKRFLFDFSFKLPFEVTTEGSVYKGHYQLNDISSDDDYEISYKLTKKPHESAKTTALQTFISVRNNGLQKEVLRIVNVFIREYQSQ